MKNKQAMRRLARKRKVLLKRNEKKRQRKRNRRKKQRRKIKQQSHRLREFQKKWLVITIKIKLSNDSEIVCTLLLELN